MFPSLSHCGYPTMLWARSSALACVTTVNFRAGGALCESRTSTCWAQPAAEHKQMLTMRPLVCFSIVITSISICGNAPRVFILRFNLCVPACRLDTADLDSGIVTGGIDFTPANRDIVLSISFINLLAIRFVADIAAWAVAQVEVGVRDGRDCYLRQFGGGNKGHDR